MANNKATATGVVESIEWKGESLTLSEHFSKVDAFCAEISNWDFVRNVDVQVTNIPDTPVFEVVFDIKNHKSALSRLEDAKKLLK
jgi:hypothetical protein